MRSRLAALIWTTSNVLTTETPCDQFRTVREIGWGVCGHAACESVGAWNAAGPEPSGESGRSINQKLVFWRRATHIHHPSAMRARALCSLCALIDLDAQKAGD